MPSQVGRSAEQRCGQAAALSYCLYPGRSPPLILLSGLGNDMGSWSPPFLDALNRLAGVLIYDRRGYGQSAPLPPVLVTAQAAAGDLDELLQVLDFNWPVVLVGHSIGGLYAQYFARCNPQRVAAVALIDAASPFEPVDDPRFRTRATLEPGTVEFYENAGIDAPIVATRNLPPFSPNPAGRADRHRSRLPSGIRARVAQSPLGHQVIAEGSGHYIQNDQPNLVVERIRDLLQQLHSQAR
jgi:pimeloyl-ACP methyl ester carboxylesterase